MSDDRDRKKKVHYIAVIMITVTLIMRGGKKKEPSLNDNGNVRVPENQTPFTCTPPAKKCQQAQVEVDTTGLVHRH